MMMAETAAELRWGRCHQLTAGRRVEAVHVAGVQVRGRSAGRRAQRDMRRGVGPERFVPHGQGDSWDLVHVHHDSGLVGTMSCSRRWAG